MCGNLADVKLFFLKGAMIMKQRMNFRTKINRNEEEKTLQNIKKHVAKLKAEHDSRQDFDFGTKGG